MERTICRKRNIKGEMSAKRCLPRKESGEMGKARRRKAPRGVLTLETAMIMPVILAVVFTCLYYCFHTHNRAMICARCAEQAISGREQPDPPLVAAAGTKFTRTDGSAERRVSGTAGTLWYTGERKWEIDESSVYEKVSPVKITRQAHAVIELFAEEG